VGDRSDWEPKPRLGYRPPPPGWGSRLLIILLAIVVGAVMIKAVADIVAAYTAQARVIDLNLIDAPGR
jgi:hypothetical protein